MKRLLLAILCVVSSGWVAAQTPANSWSNQDYTFYAGDFNGDGFTDILFVAKSASMPSGILYSDGTAPTILGQTWASNYLGIPWNSDAYTVVVGDFNGDGKTDIFLQSNGPGDSYLLLTDASGHISAISQTVSNQAMGIVWSANQHRLVVGDFNGDGHADLYFQPTAPGGISAIVYADANGQFTSATPAQIWNDGYLGFNWSVQDAIVYSGDFNGDGRADLLIQAQPFNYGGTPGTAGLIYPPNLNGVVLSQASPQPFLITGMQSWSRNDYGVDWSPLSNTLIIADFNGDGRSDVLLQPLTSGATPTLLFGNAKGPIFTPATGSLPADVPVSADTAVLVPGKFAGGAAASLLIQAATRDGSNTIAKNVASGVHPTAITFPTLTPSSVSMSGIGYPPTATAASATATQSTTGPMAATVSPTSAGRTAGQFSVTPTGAASYNVPLWTPPGARNIEPHLALHYTSGGPDGPMGPGWSLTGVSMIARCGKTWASTGGTATVVGAPAGVTLSTSDDVCMDGNRLRWVSGPSGAPLVGGTTWQTEIADFSLITASGTTGNGPQYFTVKGKDGRFYEYGNGGNSQIFASGATTPYAWMLDKISDRQGNNMVFTYTSGATTAQLAKIQYTATPGTGNAAPYEVDFNYVARAGGTTITKYVAGSAVSQANQLDNVAVYSLQPSSTLVRKYQLAYTASPTTNRPMLQTLQECAGSAGTDCLRPTTISYQSGSAGWSTTATSTGLTGQYGFIPVDLNGDGIPDVLYGKLSGSNTHWYARIATVSGYGAEIDTGANTSATQTIVPGAFSGKGLQQFLAPVSGYWYVYSYNGTGFSSAPTGVAVTGQVTGTADWDGDGLPDLVLVDESIGGGSIRVLRNTTSPGSAVSFAATPTIVFSTSDYNLHASTFAISDFDGDGRGDVFVGITSVDCTGSICPYGLMLIMSRGFAANAASFIAAPLGFASPGSATAADVNGDGCTDFVDTAVLHLSNCAGGFVNVPLNPAFPQSTKLMPVDWDGDGQTDILFVDASTNVLKLARSTGTGFAAPVSTGITAPTTRSFFPTDRDSDGQVDVMYIDSAASYAVGYYPHNGVNTPPDLATSITDGFLINFSPSYVPISQYNYGKFSNAVFPEMDFQGPMYVVNQFSASDGTGGTYTNDFYYYGARLHLQGRGFEGFYEARQHDSRSGNFQFTYYQQQFPNTGSVFETDTVESDQATYVARTTSTWTSKTPGGLAGTSCSTCYFPYTSDTVAYTYDPDYKAGGSSSYVSSASTHYTYDSYGNLTDTKVTTTDTDSAAPASPFNGQQWITEIANTITNDNSSANWCLGRPSTSTTTKTVPGQAAQTRTVNHTMDYAACRATAEIVEPNDTHLKVTTNFGFDACGNTNSVSVVGLDQNGATMPARTTTTNYSYATSRCALPELVTNPYGQSTQTIYDYNNGMPTSTKDPNNLTVSWQYDNFNRKKQENRPDGTYTTTSYTDCITSSCWGTPDLRLLVTSVLYSSAGTSVRTAEKFYDGMDRLKYEEGNRVLGVWTSAQTNYDSLGRKSQVFMPYSAGGYGNGYHLYQYDIANRMTRDWLFDNTAKSYRAINIGYTGQTVTVYDPMGYPITKVTDVSGKIRQVTDPNANATMAGTTYYTFDPFGNLSQITDADGITSTYAYNIRGFKTASSDADTGSWMFTPNSLNELVSQKDANGQVTSFGYDLLGRMTSRTEPESTTPTQFIYGTNASLHEIGHLTQATKSDGYAESYTFDGVSRPQTVTYTEDGVNYPFTYAYNTQGTVDTLTYPVSTSGYSFVLKSVYDAYGYLNQVKDNAAGTVFWTLNSANDSSLPTSETLGNGVQVATGYTPWTNEMTSHSEGTGTSTTNLQNLSYNWDLSGNLHQRIDNRQNLTEQFGYDAMNRLLNSTLNGTTSLTLTYTASGNIATKSDVGSAAYVYDTVHKHAVKTAGGWSMGYDNNGNMTSRAGGTITWYSYNLPNAIAYSGNSTQFFYNANHQRWKQVAHYGSTTETTHYIGGLLEILTRGSSPTEYRHQIPCGSSGAVYTRRTDGTSSTYYATSDHLGSSDLVMDSSANVLARESFTPFGARRGSSWAGNPSASDFTAFQNTTRKGFTGHEMLDSVSLVHMNGRVYDPYLGRFISADTVIQNLAATESINPYAYAWNDPLRYVDPSGHDPFDVVAMAFGLVLGYFTFGLANAFLASEFVIGASIYAGAIAGFVGGFVGAMISTGSLSAALTAGLISGITAGLFNAAGGAFAGNSAWATTERTLAHAFIGCASAAASGGNCGKGALAAAVTEGANSTVLKGNEFAKWGADGQLAARTALSGLIGGVADRIVGGNFVEGFSIAAAGYLYNTWAHARGIDTVITRDDGSEEIRSGGSLSWRNNNPGNMRDTAFSEDEGAIGSAHGFAVFPSEDIGRTALSDLLQTDTYQNLTIGDAINRYAPPVENNTANYTHLIEQFTGLPASTSMAVLSDSQLQSVVGAIQRIEGWSVGTVTIRRPGP